MTASFGKYDGQDPDSKAVDELQILVGFSLVS